jgi:hypothetical protein
LNKNKDPYLEKWNLDLASKKNKKKYGDLIDREKQNQIERQVSKIIQNNFSFSVIPVKNKDKRLKFESKLISTVSLCKECPPSKKWLGLNSPKKKIKNSGLWLVNELYKKPLSGKEIKELISQNTDQTSSP